jgi:predicted permease
MKQARTRTRRVDERGARWRTWADLLFDAVSDVRLAVRSLRKARGYAAVTVLSLAVGIGVNAAVLTAVYAVWFSPVPGVTEQDRIVDPVTVQEGADYWGWTFPDFAAVREAETPFQFVTAWLDESATLGGEDGRERIPAAYASADYFRVLGVVPALGRGFLPAEDAGPGQHPVAVVSHDLWQYRFDGDPNILGRAITVNRTPHTVVGVAPEGFHGARVNIRSVDLWVPLVQHPEMQREESFVTDRGRYSVQVLGRLRPGSTRAECQAALQTVFGRLAADHPETNEYRTVRAEAFGRFPAQNRRMDMIAVIGLWGMLVVLLLIICSNLAGMALVRSASREHEIGVRLALGSSRIRLVQLLMVEALVLALAGGAMGTAMAMLGMATVSPVDLGIAAPGVTFRPSGWVIATSFVLAVGAAIAFGLVPALRFSRPELVSALKDDTGGGGRRVGRLQRFAVSAQAGAAFSLLVVGALFLRSLERTDERALGFQPNGMLVTDFQSGGFFSTYLDLSDEGYPTLEEGGAALLDQLGAALETLPGVTAVAMGDGIPLDRVGSLGRTGRADRPDEVENRVAAEVTRVSEGFFAAIGVPILQGRGFLPGDDAASEPVVVVTRSLAERLWPGESGLGRRLLWPAGSDSARPRTVVGVVGRVASSRAGRELPQLFLPVRQDYPSHLMLVLRTAAGASGVAGSLGEALRSVDPGLPAPRLLTGRTIVVRATRDQRAVATLGGGLGLVVLVLSAIGAYGVVALAVATRTREIGLRMALGANRGDIIRRVLGDAVRLSVPGLIVGGLVAAGTAAAARSMLLGISPLDPVAFLAAGGLLLAVVLLAGLAPALRASGMEPARALQPR